MRNKYLTRILSVRDKSSSTSSTLLNAHLQLCIYLQLYSPGSVQHSVSLRTLLVKRLPLPIRNLELNWSEIFHKQGGKNLIWVEKYRWQQNFTEHNIQKSILKCLQVSYPCLVWRDLCVSNISTRKQCYCFQCFHTSPNIVKTTAKFCWHL